MDKEHKPKKFKIWIEIERITLDAKGNEDEYEDEECHILGECGTLEEANAFAQAIINREKALGWLKTD